MPFDPATTALQDILRNIDLANQFVGGLKRETFLADERSIYAVTRCLEIISEASKRLPDGLKARYPQIAWKQMAAAGNVYRHDYEEVAGSFVGDTIHKALPSLRVVVTAELAAR